MHTQASSFVQLGFIVLPVLVVGLFLWAVRFAARDRYTVSCALASVWLLLWAGLASAGVLARFDLRPPPMLLMIAAASSAAVWLGWSRLGGRIAHALPLWLLVLAQGFRLPLELLMHQAAAEGVMPNVLSFTGYNFDIVTGASAFVLSYALRRGAGRSWAWLWNCFGSLCLLAIVVIAILSSPNMARFGPHELNGWVTRFPFVWLPSVLVVFAVAGQIVVFRKLQLMAAGRVSAAPER
jgi:hypothetical protein